MICAVMHRQEAPAAREQEQGKEDGKSELRHEAGHRCGRWRNYKEGAG